MMRAILIAACLLAAAPPSQAADAATCGYSQGAGGWYKQADRSGPYALDGDCSATLLGVPVPLNVMAMPFVRIGDPFMLPASPAPQQHQINQPAGTTTYRIVNPCTVDIRIRTVASLSSTVTATTGTRILARTVETLASSPPLTTPRIVSIMTMGDPGANGCTTELGYGNGG